MEQQAITEPDVQELFSKILELVNTDEVEKIQQHMDENKPRVMDYFETNGWTQQHLKEMKCSKIPDSNVYFLGECMNCNGVCIDADDGGVMISTFDANGEITRPYMRIGKNYFTI